MATKIKNLLFGDTNIYENVAMYPYNEFAWDSNIGIFADIIVELKPQLIVEVGTWIGGSAIAMAKASASINLVNEIVCIDTWLGSVEHWGEVCNMNTENGRPIIYKEFISNVVQCSLQDVITPFPVDSTNGLLFLKKHNIKADLVYVDAGHDYQSVCNDLYNASNIVRNGGWILGDDYHHPDVRRAAQDVFGKFYINDIGSKFIWKK